MTEVGERTKPATLALCDLVTPPSFKVTKDCFSGSPYLFYLPFFMSFFFICLFGFFYVFLFHFRSLYVPFAPFLLFIFRYFDLCFFFCFFFASRLSHPPPKSREHRGHLIRTLLIDQQDLAIAGCSCPQNLTSNHILTILKKPSITRNQNTGIPGAIRQFDSAPHSRAAIYLQFFSIQSRHLHFDCCCCCTLLYHDRLPTNHPLLPLLLLLLPLTIHCRRCCCCCYCCCFCCCCCPTLDTYRMPHLLKHHRHHCAQARPGSVRISRPCGPPKSACLNEAPPATGG